MNSEELLQKTTSFVANASDKIEQKIEIDMNAVIIEVKKDLIRSIKESADLNKDGVFNIKDLDLNKDGKFSIKESGRAFNRMFKRFRSSLKDLSYKKIYFSIIYSIIALIGTMILEELSGTIIDGGTMKFISKLIIFGVSFVPLISLDDIKRTMSNQIAQLQEDNSLLVKDNNKKSDTISDLTYSKTYWERKYNDVKEEKEKKE